MNTADTAAVYTDFSALRTLKAQAASDADGALDKVARQFESLFMGQMLKAMRQASQGEGILDSDQSLFYRDMFDQQLALHLSTSGGIGLADAIKRQLGKGMPAEAAAAGKTLDEYREQPVQRAKGVDRTAGPIRAAQVNGNSSNSSTTIEPLQIEDPAQWDHGEFVENLWPWALEAAQQLGLQPEALVAQAALETGWGRHMSRMADGTPSLNLFNIKADSRWDGDRVQLNTLEYEQGVAVRRRDYFRAYGSLRDSFQDYVRFLQSNPRYQDALQATESSREYFSALQQAGYATDPRYAEKIDTVLNGQEMERAMQRIKLSQSRPL